MTYKSLEQQIRELWVSRGLEVIEERVEPVDENTFKWTIIAREEKDEIGQELNDLYELNLKAKKVAVVFTPLELEHLNTVIDLGAESRKSHLMREARKEKRKLNKWEKHLIGMDRKVWRKIREAEKLSLNE